MFSNFLSSDSYKKMLSNFYFSKTTCSSRKNPYPPPGRSSEIPRGRAVLKVKILEAKYEAKLEFPGEDGECKKKKKNPPWGEYGYFLEVQDKDTTIPDK